MTDFAKLVLDADTKGLKRGERDLIGVGNTAQKTASRVDKSSGVMSGAFSRVARVGILPLVGAIGGAVVSINSLVTTNATFGASMQKVAAISGATGAELERLRQTAKDLGASTEFSASQAADALGFLSMAGFSAAESMEAIPSVLSLATAGSLELASAADIASNVLSGFGLAAGEAGRASDVLASAASQTNTSVSQLGQAMSTAAPIAAALGVSMEETAAAIGVMSDAGIQGERAGTALRGVFASLAGPTTQAQEALAKYGLTAADISPETQDLADVMDKLGAANISTADAMTIFGREAASGALVMIDAAGRVRELTQAFEGAEGAADKMAKTMADNLGGDLKALQSAIEGLIIQLGDGGASGIFRDLAQTATASLRSITENLNTLMTVVGSAVVGFVTYKTTVIAVTAVQAAYNSTLFNAVGIAVLDARNTAAATAAKIAYSGATAAATVATRGLTAALIANPFTAVAAAVGILAAAFYGLRDSQAAARAETNNLIASLRSLAQARSASFAMKRMELKGDISSSERRLTGLQREYNELRRMGQSEKTVLGLDNRMAALGKQIRNTQYEIGSMNKGLFEADWAFQKAGEAASKMNAPVAQTSVAVANVGTASGGASKAVGGLSGGMSAASKAADQFKSSMQSLADRLFPATAALREYRKELDMIAQAEAQGLWTPEMAGQGRARLRNEYLDEQYGEVKVNVMPLNELKDVNALMKKAGENLDMFGQKTRAQTVQIAKSFKDMATEALNSLDRLVGAIKGGGFFDILSGLVGFGLQLGSIGVFGKSVQKNINSAPSFAGGGFTGSGSRSGGIDGKGGFHAILHPNETVIDHTKGGGAMNVTVTMDPSTGALGAFVRDESGRVVSEAAPAIANAGASVANTRMARTQRRQV